MFSSAERKLYASNFRPVLEYACDLWVLTKKCLLDSIVKTQNHSARYVTGNFNYTYSVTTLKDCLKWAPLCNRRKLFRIKFIHNTFHGKTGIN